MVYQQIYQNILFISFSDQLNYDFKATQLITSFILTLLDFNVNKHFFT